MEPIFFLKFSERTHIESLLNRGEIFMNVLEAHRKFGGNSQRHDKHEGAISSKYMEDFVVDIKAQGEESWKQLKVVSANFNQFTDTANWLVYSLYMVSRNDFLHSNPLKVDSSMREFGSTFLMIRYPGDFVRRILEYLRSEDYEVYNGPVSYYSLKDGAERLTFFNKPDTYAHQKEYRIVARRKEVAPLKFEIGSLESYSEIYDSSVIEKMLVRL